MPGVSPSAISVTMATAIQASAEIRRLPAASQCSEIGTLCDRFDRSAAPIAEAAKWTLEELSDAVHCHRTAGRLRELSPDELVHHLELCVQYVEILSSALSERPAIAEDRWRVRDLVYLVTDLWELCDREIDRTKRALHEEGQGGLSALEVVSSASPPHRAGHALAVALETVYARAA